MWWGQVKCTPPRYCDVELSIHCKLSHVVRSSQMYTFLDIVMLELSIHCKLSHVVRSSQVYTPRYCDVGVVHSLQVVPCGEVKSSVHLLDIVMLSCPFIASCPMWWGQVKCTPPRYCDVGVVHSLQVVPCGEVKSSVHLLDIVMLKLSIHCKLSHVVRSSQVYTS